MPPGSDSSAIGGIQSDVDDGDERDYTVEVTENAMFARAKVTSIAGIVETDAPGLVASSARRHGGDKIKKADIKLTDIPDEIRSQFKTRFTPPLLSFVGTIRGWEDASTSDVIQIWNDVFPDYAVSTEDPRDNQLVLVNVITKLAQDKVDGWRNKLGTAGVAVWNRAGNRAVYGHGRDQDGRVSTRPSHYGPAGASERPHGTVTVTVLRCRIPCGTVTVASPSSSTRCADGHFRRAIYGLGPYIADYPEQALLTCIVQGYCPRCLSPAHDLDRDSPRRCAEHTDALLGGCTLKELWDDFGIVGGIIVSLSYHSALPA
ncbi:hypothetical protein MVEN_00132200 [Mycena venus]|uniref:Uncharacterized protein n=1 Tax=Mycena venus TaxID=2733690 RepID=A0A8H7DHR2_9AGAR|nr:hypothetical protein MVEN_00132200 [Mycena venus]